VQGIFSNTTLNAKLEKRKKKEEREQEEYFLKSQMDFVKIL